MDALDLATDPFPLCPHCGERHFSTVNAKHTENRSPRMEVFAYCSIRQECFGPMIGWALDASPHARDPHPIGIALSSCEAPSEANPFPTVDVLIR